MPSWTNDRRRTSALTAIFIFTCARSGDWTIQNETANQTSRDLTQKSNISEPEIRVLFQISLMTSHFRSICHKITKIYNSCALELPVGRKNCSFRSVCKLNSLRFWLRLRLTSMESMEGENSEGYVSLILYASAITTSTRTHESLEKTSL